METERRLPPVREEFCEWRAPDLTDTDGFLLRLSPQEHSEIRAALGQIKRSGLPQSRLRRADVPLNGLCTRLAGLRDDVIFGRGFGLIRRLPVDRLGDADAEQLMCGLAAHVGRLRPVGEGPGAVSDWTGQESPAADLMGLLCLSAAPSGTSLTLASAVAVHNDLARTRPDLLASLYRPTSLGRPVFALSGRQVSARLGFTELERLALDAEQAEACALASDFARQGAIELEFEPGDLLFVNAHHVVVRVAHPAPTRFHAGDMGAVRFLDARSGRVSQVALGSPHIAIAAQVAPEETAERAAA